MLYIEDDESITQIVSLRKNQYSYTFFDENIGYKITLYGSNMIDTMIFCENEESMRVGFGMITRLITNFENYIHSSFEELIEEMNKLYNGQYRFSLKTFLSSKFPSSLLRNEEEN